jgi:hypothetical protein
MRAMKRRNAVRVSAVGVVVMLGLAACSGSDSDSSTSATGAETTVAESTAPETTTPETTTPETTTPETTTVASSAATAGVLDGIWWKPLHPDVSRDIPITFQFGPGDLFVLDGRALLTDPVFRGRYTYVDDVVTYVDNEIVDGPCLTGGGNNRMAITIVDDGQVDTEALEQGGCSGEVGTPGAMIRLSPASTAGRPSQRLTGDSTTP